MLDSTFILDKQKYLFFTQDMDAPCAITAVTVAKALKKAHR
jgi:hypothetical protein